MELNQRSQLCLKPQKNNMSNIAIIEYQTPGGSWQKVCECSKHPSTIKQIMDATFRSNPSYQKLRARDQETGQLIDISIR